MTKLLLILLLFCIKLNVLIAQEQSYEIIVASKKVGSLRVSQTEKGDKQIIKAQTDAEVSILWKHHVKKTNWELHFEDDVLIKSSTISHFNGDLEDSVMLQYHQPKYVGYLHPDQRIVIDRPIVITTSNLYYREPLKIDSVFSERFLAWCKLELVSENKYKLILPDGTMNSYTYSSGILKEIYVDRPWFNIKIVRESAKSETPK